jgi:catechol 2,3-dioxygenase-like lactoylglutathione lyase family enzyme
MVDHVSLRVQDIGRAKGFYRSALAALGYEVVMEFPDAIGMGEKGKPDLWLMQTGQPINPGHIALRCTRAQVDAFHAAALAAGASDNGPPGPRPDYHAHYYASFVRDPEGNNIEAVCHDDPTARPVVAAKAKAKPPAKVKAKVSAKAKPKAAKKPAKKSAAKAKPTKKRRR